MPVEAPPNPTTTALSSESTFLWRQAGGFALGIVTHPGVWFPVGCVGIIWVGAHVQHFLLNWWFSSQVTHGPPQYDARTYEFYHVSPDPVTYQNPVVPPMMREVNRL